jgi:hypothetical protein
MPFGQDSVEASIEQAGSWLERTYIARCRPGLVMQCMSWRAIWSRSFRASMALGETDSDDLLQHGLNPGLGSHEFLPGQPWKRGGRQTYKPPRLVN